MTMRKRSYKLHIVAGLVIASLAILGPSEAAAQSDPCAVPVTAPAGGFAATNLSAGQEVPMIALEFTAIGDASFACVSDYPGFPPPDPQWGALFYCYPLTGSGQVVPQWTLSPDFGKDKHVYVQYNRCQAPQPPTVNPVIDIPVSFWPAACDQAPIGNFQAVVVGGSNVTSPNININLTSYGNASHVQFSNDPTFPPAATITESLSYGYSGPTPWTLPHLGTNIIYIRYTNGCPPPAPSESADVTVTYLAATCRPSNPPPWFGLGSATGNNNVTSSNVTLALSNGINGGLMRISNNQNLSAAPYVPYTTRMAWTLPLNKGSHTVWGQACTACGRCSYPTSYTFVLR